MPARSNWPQTCLLSLNQRGMRQAEQLARRLFAHGFVHILYSDFLRARMTAVLLAACSGITIEESTLLQERNFGDLRGVPYVELTEDPFGPDFVPPNGEDWPRFHARVAEAFAFIVSRRRAVNGTLVVVTRLVLGLGYPHDSFDRGIGEFCGLF